MTQSAWTTEKPTKPGWYWFLESGIGERIVEIRAVPIRGLLIVCWVSGRRADLADLFGGWQPVEPAKE